jgi:hypothetical protein
MKYLLALLALTISALAQTTVDVSFIWDANPPSDNVTEYRIYELFNGTTVLRTSTAETTGTVKAVVLDADRTFICRAVNVAGESPNSNAVTLDHKALLAELVPGAPAGMSKVKVTITIELQ